MEIDINRAKEFGCVLTLGVAEKYERKEIEKKKNCLEDCVLSYSNDYLYQLIKDVCNALISTEEDFDIFYFSDIKNFIEFIYELETDEFFEINEDNINDIFYKFVKRLEEILLKRNKKIEIIGKDERVWISKKTKYKNK